MENENKVEKLTVIQQIMTYLKNHATASVEDLAKATGKKHDSTSVSINKLLKAGYIKRVNFGIYSLSGTNPAVDHVHVGDKPHDDATTQRVKHKFKLRENDNEDLLMNEFMRLKGLYTRDKLLRVLPQWIKILE